MTRSHLLCGTILPHYDRCAKITFSLSITKSKLLPRRNTETEVSFPFYQNKPVQGPFCLALPLQPTRFDTQGLNYTDNDNIC